MFLRWCRSPVPPGAGFAAEEASACTFFWLAIRVVSLVWGRWRCLACCVSLGRPLSARNTALLLRAHRESQAPCLCSTRGFMHTCFHLLLCMGRVTAADAALGVAVRPDHRHPVPAPCRPRAAPCSRHQQRVCSVYVRFVKSLRRRPACLPLAATDPPPCPPPPLRAGRAPTWRACSAAPPAPPPASPTPRPTRRRPSRGARRRCTTTCLTPRSTSPVRAWALWRRWRAHHDHTAYAHAPVVRGMNSPKRETCATDAVAAPVACLRACARAPFCRPATRRAKFYCCAADGC